MVARGIEVDAVLRGVVVDLAAVGGVGQGLADVDIVAALAQRHVGQQVVDRGNAGVVQTGLGGDHILLYAWDGLDINRHAGVQLLTQHINEALVVGDKAVLTALHDEVVRADKDIKIIRLAGGNGLHRGLVRTGDGVLDADIVDKGLHARADVGGVVGIVVACIVDAKARRDAVAREGDGVEIVVRHGAQHRDGHHAVIGVAVLGVDRGRDGLGLVPRGGIDARQDALRLGNVCRGCRGGLGGHSGGCGLLRRSGFRWGSLSRGTLPREPEVAHADAERRQNNDEDQEQSALAAPACDLIAVGIKISHKSSYSLRNQACIAIIRRNRTGYKWPQQILQTEKGTFAKISLTLFSCTPIIRVRIDVTNHHRTEVLPHGMDDRIRQLLRDPRAGKPGTGRAVCPCTV